MLLNITAKRQLRHIINKYLTDLERGVDINVVKDNLYRDIVSLCNIGGDIIDRRY
ncbi:MAG: hypothetical protein PWQ43_754 [Rikenellaceae bacterium]|nr:hypothetical protein [Rikenellaceae bacterium]